MLKPLTCLLLCAAYVAGQEQFYRERSTPKDGGVKNTFFAASDEVFPHFATGGEWETVLVIVNMSNQRIDFRQEFRATDGSPLPVTFRSIPDGVTTTTSSTEGTLGPRSSFNILLSHSGALQTGWSSLEYDTSLGQLGGYSTFRSKLPGRVDLEALVPLSSIRDYKFYLPIDNLQNFVTAIAIANPGAAATNVRLTMLDMSGTEIGNTTINIPGLGQTSFAIADRFPAAAGRIGTLYVEGSTDRLSAIGLRFNPGGAFSSVPIMNWSGMFP